MLLHLRIENFAIVPGLAQDFEPGFTAISGETGAGKSILVDALGLLTGSRSDSSWVRAGADRAELNAEFSVAGNRDAREWLAEHELDDGDICLLRRTIQATGRSRAWINGTPVTVQQLGDLGSRLLELHGQHEHVRLTGRRRQLELLDETGGHAAALDAVRDAFDAWRTLQTQLDRLTDSAIATPGEFEFMSYQLEELERAALDPDAIAALEGEHRLLAGSGDLLTALQQAARMLDAEETGATSALSRAVATLEPYGGLDPEIGSARQMLSEALINCQEALVGLGAAGERIDLSPERLEEVEMRLSALSDLARKHRVRMEELAAVRDDLRQRLADAQDFDRRRERLEQQRDQCLTHYRSRAEQLSQLRGAHAAQLAPTVAALMEDLGMRGGSFAIEVTHEPESAPSPLGNDRVEILVSANPGIPPGPLAKIASGGELSRIGLAIKVACADASGERTQIFDEVDAGIGGDTANAVGAMLRRAARGGQALCVTHLAQIAVRADHQLLVHKEAGDDSTRLDARWLNEQARVEEIARMLGGSRSGQGLEHAREMLEAARSTLQ